MFVLVFWLFFSNLYSSVNIYEFQKDINSIVQKSNGAVVSIKVSKEGAVSVIEPEFYFGYMIPEEKIYKYKMGGIGSGVIISPDGYLVTNYHVIEDADEINIEISEDNKKTTYKANYVGGEKKLDIAILKIKSNNKKFQYLNFSSSPVNIGDIVLAVGYPFGFKQTYTMGIVSSKNVNLKVEGKAYNDLIQTDAAINQGNSGGPLLNIRGEIVGINSAIYSPSGAFAGVGFAIPSWKIRQVVDEVIYNKAPERGWMGVSLIPTDLVMRKIMSTDIPKGGIINKVYDNSPAQKAGLKRGDIIVSVDNDEVESDEDLVYRIYYKKPGDKISVSYIRNGKKYNAELVLSKRPKDSDMVMEKNSNNSYYDKNKNNIYKFNGLDLVYSDEGAVVKDVGKDSPLRNYIKKGDIIKGVNNNKITDYRSMADAFSRADISEGILIDMIRDGEPFYLSIQVK
ncbi:MAG TPA: trypsin-like peptidase domain-containing protein [Elusimicrobiales bacterium]|nr:trypsin-like peptidase domain-containing protein [Elusimicrobiales bacterium]HPO94605.1 trypsin-like peptidase domain-containing protein [Elusimicrobiales bacterium]